MHGCVYIVIGLTKAAAMFPECVGYLPDFEIEVEVCSESLDFLAAGHF